MSSLLIARNPDLTRLRTEGYDIAVHTGINKVIVRNIPYVTVEGAVAYGTLYVAMASRSDEEIGPPQSHQAYFAGSFPHKAPGVPISVLSAAQAPEVHQLGDELIAQFHFSYKTQAVTDRGGLYAGYYELVVEYVDVIQKYAKRVESTVDARNHHVDDLEPVPSVLRYADSASSRSKVMHVAEKLKGLKVAIIGVGGTGSYILDFLTKTHLGEIHIYDPDVFGQHNAFRAPGAATRDEVFAVPPIYKVDYLKDKYDPIHSAITPHRQAVTEIGPEFGGYDFVFVCIDKPQAKKPIVDGLIGLNKSFIDVGLSVSLSESSLSGVLRTTMSTPACRDQRHKIDFTDDVNDDYRTPIQIAELNALNAALAVIRWKQELGFYRASGPRYSNLYSIDFNRIDNDEPRDANAS